MNIRILLYGLSIGLTGICHAQESKKSAKEIAYTAAYRERDTTKAIQLGTAFLKNYPLSGTDHAFDHAHYIEYSRIYYSVISRSKNMEGQIRHYEKELPFLAVDELYYRQVHLLNLHKIQTADQLVERSRLLIEKLKAFKDSIPEEFSQIKGPDEDWKKRYATTYYGNLLDHVNILRRSGNTAEALGYAQEVLDYYGYGIAGFNEDYVQLLKTAGMKEREQEALESAIRANQASPLMISILRENYVANHSGEDGFDAYMSSLKDLTALKAEIKSKMIQRDIPAFTVYDAQGKQVSSNNWKGKVVVLDFWASWCVPCKAAFPGMKMAQDAFTNDSSVVFYFVVVHEPAGGYREKALRFIEDNHFPFQLLFDGKDDQKTSDEAADLLGVGVIPRKLVLDKNGKVRFDTNGYYGSPSKLADEVRIMVALTKDII